MTLTQSENRLKIKLTITNTYRLCMCGHYPFPWIRGQVGYADMKPYGGCCGSTEADERDKLRKASRRTISLIPENFTR